MRIGDIEITQGRSAPHATDTRKTGKRAGAATTIPEDKRTAALNAYEEHQRVSFETEYWNETDDMLGIRLYTLKLIGDQGDDLRRRRVAAERWAIERILKRRGDGV